MALKSQGILYEVLFLLIGKQEKKMNLEETEVQNKRKTRGLFPFMPLMITGVLWSRVGSFCSESTVGPSCWVLGDKDGFGFCSPRY